MEYDDLINDREFFAAMVKLGEACAAYEKKRGVRFSQHTSEFIDEFAALEAQATAKIAEHEAAMGHAIDGPPAEDAWLHDAMRSSLTDNELLRAYVRYHVKRANVTVTWEP